MIENSTSNMCAQKADNRKKAVCFCFALDFKNVNYFHTSSTHTAGNSSIAAKYSFTFRLCHESGNPLKPDKTAPVFLNDEVVFHFCRFHIWNSTVVIFQALLQLSFALNRGLPADFLLLHSIFTFLYLLSYKIYKWYHGSFFFGCST